MEFSVSQIATLLNGEVEGDESIRINDLGKIQEAGKGCLAFLANPKYEHFIYETNASAVLVKKDFEATRPVRAVLIRVEDPYLSFTRLISEYAREYVMRKNGVEQPSFMADTVSHDEGIYRGAFSYIGENVKIGKNVKIYPHAYIGDNTVIGDNCILYAGVKIYEDTRIGNDCVLHAGAVLGSDGFGYAPKKDGTYQTIPQLGHVILENNVHIGANTTIDCATFRGDATVIGEGSKLDNQIQIGHNVRIGSNTVIAGASAIAGSTTIGNNCVLAGQVGIVGHLNIGDRVTIGAQSGVIKDIPDDATWFGTPAFDHKKSVRSYSLFRKLPEFFERLNTLEKNQKKTE